MTDKKKSPKQKKWRAFRLVIYTFCGVENQAEYRKTKTMAPKVKTQKLAGVPLWPARAQSHAHPSEPDNKKNAKQAFYRHYPAPTAQKRNGGRSALYVIADVV